MGRGRQLYLATAVSVTVLDQLVKAAVDRFLALHESRVVVDGLIHLTYVRNRGAAFGILSEAELPYQSLLFSLVSAVALLAIAAYAWRLPPASRLPRLALSLVIGGAVGNLIDRIRLGYVIDFVDVFWKSYHWPAFNLADSAISVGVVLLVLDLLRSPQGGTRRDELPASPGG
jgi:signal peptidase II